MRNVKIKICGITNPDDLTMAAEAGADFFGVILLHSPSPRSMALQSAQALFSSPPLLGVAVTVDLNQETLTRVINQLHPFALQLHGNESPELIRWLKKNFLVEVWKAVKIAPGTVDDKPSSQLLDTVTQYCEAGADHILLDSQIAGKAGGTGIPLNWQLARTLTHTYPLPFILAGGLNPKNVVNAIHTVAPWGIDVSTGIELRAGKKDPKKLRQLMERIDSQQIIQRREP